MRLPVFILLPIFLAVLNARTATPLDTLPPVILWAWERPENLDFIDPQKAGVAFLAKTITLRGDKTLVRPRLQPLQLAAGTRLIAVVRIETDGATLSPAQLQQTADQITNLSGTSVVQIDFDATVSERNFYRALLTQVRRELPASIALSITALASWCASDSWLADLPIDEAVPMLFRMGVERPQFQRRVTAGQPFESRICRNAAGVSTDEPVKTPPVHRLYIFNPTSWSESSLNNALEAYKK